MAKEKGKSKAKGKPKECVYKHCYPETHTSCQQCQTELRTRHDCKSGKNFQCYSCPGVVCERCCKKVPKIEWETFHNKYIKIFKPKCMACGDLCYQSEGFVVKVKGKMGCVCSHSCLEENNIQEDPDWDIWKMHPPEDLLRACS